MVEEQLTDSLNHRAFNHALYWILFLTQKGNQMKVTFKDSNLQCEDTDVIVLDLDILPRVGESIFFDQSIMPEVYLDFAKRYGYIVKDETAEGEDIYTTVKANIEYVNHVFKVQEKAKFVDGTATASVTVHSIEIEINFEHERSNGTGDTDHWYK